MLNMDYKEAYGFLYTAFTKAVSEIDKVHSDLMVAINALKVAQAETERIFLGEGKDAEEK